MDWGMEGLGLMVGWLEGGLRMECDELQQGTEGDCGYRYGILLTLTGLEEAVLVTGAKRAWNELQNSIGR